MNKERGEEDKADLKHSHLELNEPWKGVAYQEWERESESVQAVLSGAYKFWWAFCCLIAHMRWALASSSSPHCILSSHVGVKGNYSYHPPEKAERKRGRE